MNKKIKCGLVILLLTLFSLNLYSQYIKSYEAGMKIRISPITMLDYTPRLRVGFEYVNKTKFQYGIDVGIGNSVLNKCRLNGLGWGNDYSFFEIRPEVKYVYRTSNSFLLYCSSELFFLQLTDHMFSGDYQIRGNQAVVVSYDEADFKKQKTGMHLKIGADFNVYKRFYFDVYCGIGFANRSIAYNNVINSIENEGLLFVEWFSQPHLFEGQENIIHITGGFRISYLLFSKCGFNISGNN